MASSSYPRRIGPSSLITGELCTERDRLRDVRRRRGRLLVLGLVATSALLIAYDVVRPAGPGTPAAAGPVVTSPAPTRPATPTPAPVIVPLGAGTFSYATGSGAVLGRSGPLQRYRVAAEDGVGIAPAAFAEAVDAVLGDPRSWIASGNLRLQRVAGDVPAAFTVYLASPVTSEHLCREAGLETEQFTNCRLYGKVVINSARWLTAVPDYGAPLAVYQAYAVNHEVGHQLGEGHQLCPGPGQPAPVMQQQTLGLNGCVANSWPYLDGVRYRGPATDG
jgi:hypothetical protein